MTGAQLYMLYQLAMHEHTGVVVDDWDQLNDGDKASWGDIATKVIANPRNRR